MRARIFHKNIITDKGKPDAFRRHSEGTLRTDGELARILFTIVNEPREQLSPLPLQPENHSSQSGGELYCRESKQNLYDSNE